MTQAFYEGFPWTIHRNHGGWPRWWQRGYEAWLVVTGRYTFWHAWHDGKHRGSADEYQRIIGNGGDLRPILDAAIYETFREAVNGEPSVDFTCDVRRKAWQRYERTRSAESLALSRPHQHTPGD